MTQTLDRTHIDGAAFACAMPLMPCDAADGYNFERIGKDRYRLTLAAPGFEAGEIDVSADGGFLRITGASRHADAAGHVLHRGLEATLDRTFLMTRPLEVSAVELRHGLLRIALRERPGACVQAMMPPRLRGVEALALAA